MVLYAGGLRFKSPVCTRKEPCAGIVFLGGGGGDPTKVERKFPKHFGICEISHKAYISRKFSHQYMEKF
jgi:hypothetical protein